MDDYVSMAPLAGEAFTMDAAEVHTLIVNFLAENQLTESKIQAHAQMANGWMDFNAIKDHHQGVGLFANDIQEANETIDKLYNLGENMALAGYSWRKA